MPNLLDENDDHFDIHSKPERPYRVIDGKRWVLADDEPVEYDEPDNFHIVPPPRAVPLGVRLKLIFGGATASFGLSFAAFALIFATVPAYMLGLEDAIPKNWQPAGQANIVAVEYARLTVNETPYDMYSWETTDENGNKTGEGKICAPGGRFKVGDVAQMENSGRHYRFAGTGTAYHVWAFIGMGWLFAVIGLSITGNSVATGLRTIPLLRDGEIGQAIFVGSSPTGMQVNDNSVMKIKLQHEVNGEQYQFNVHTLNYDDLDHNKSQLTFYDPLNPSHAVIAELLPTGIKIEEQTGQFRCSVFRSIFPVLLSCVIICEVAAFVMMIVRAVL